MVRITSTNSFLCYIVSFSSIFFGSLRSFLIKKFFHFRKMEIIFKNPIGKPKAVSFWKLLFSFSSKATLPFIEQVNRKGSHFSQSFRQD